MNGMYWFDEESLQASEPNPEMRRLYRKWRREETRAVLGLCLGLTLAGLCWGAGVARADTASPATNPPPDPIVSTTAVRVSTMLATLWLWQDFQPRPKHIVCYPRAGSDNSWWDRRGGNCIVTITIADDAGRFTLVTEQVQIRLNHPGCTPAYNPAVGAWRYPMHTAGGKLWRGICLRGTESVDERARITKMLHGHTWWTK